VFKWVIQALTGFRPDMIKLAEKSDSTKAINRKIEGGYYEPAG
jgi:hypothetical protein